jgi:hypothetical protein
MTIFEVAADLPNGFHDAEVESIRIDYATRTVGFELDVWVGTADERELYRRAMLTVTDFQYCAMDVPDQAYPFSGIDTLTIDLFEATQFVPVTAAYGCRLWVGQWNGFIHLAAEAASLKWKGEPVHRT